MIREDAFHYTDGKQGGAERTGKEPMEETDEANMLQSPRPGSGKYIPILIQFMI